MIEITVSAVVMANDETHAYRVAKAQAKNIFFNAYEPSIDVQHVIKTSDDLTDGWDMECIPYGGDGNTKLRNLI